METTIIVSVNIELFFDRLSIPKIRIFVLPSVLFGVPIELTLLFIESEDINRDKTLGI